MPDTPLTRKDVLDIIKESGKLTAASPVKAGGQQASYIKEIIGGDVDFDEHVLNRVVAVLSKANPK